MGASSVNSVVGVDMPKMLRDRLTDTLWGKAWDDGAAGTVNLKRTRADA